MRICFSFLVRVDRRRARPGVLAGRVREVGLEHHVVFADLVDQVLQVALVLLEPSITRTSSASFTIGSPSECRAAFAARLHF